MFLVDQIGKSVPVYSLVKNFVKVKTKFSANVFADLADGVVKVENDVIFLYFVFKRFDILSTFMIIKSFFSLDLLVVICYNLYNINNVMVFYGL